MTVAFPFHVTHTPPHIPTYIHPSWCPQCSIMSPKVAEWYRQQKEEGAAESKDELELGR